jgi:hypothetical protein
MVERSFRLLTQDRLCCGLALKPALNPGMIVSDAVSDGVQVTMRRHGLIEQAQSRQTIQQLPLRIAKSFRSKFECTGFRESVLAVAEV